LTAPTRELADGRQLPALGLGTWRMDDAGAEVAVGEAIRIGYRLIDTAASYDNEAGVGRAVRGAEVPREDLVVTTKLRGADQGYDATRAGFEASARRLGLDRIDLYLIHWPLPSIDRYVDSWRAMIRLRDEGRIGSIGVSNFTPAQVERLVAETGVLPVVNQIELHPELQQAELRAWHAAHDIVTESWRPLGRGPLEAPPMAAIARTHGRTPAQVILRWHIELGAVPIPKSADPGRMRENLEVFDFDLTAEELEALAALDRGRRLGGDPDEHVEL
jgi:diketogulonate reductase-like aldo/keto reductase